MEGPSGFKVFVFVFFRLKGLPMPQPSLCHLVVESVHPKSLGHKVTPY